MATAAVIVLQVVTVTTAVGIPVKTTLLADVDETVVVRLKPIVTVAAPVPNSKLFAVADIDAVVAVMMLVPVSGPNIQTPKPGVVMVDETTVRPVAEASATKYIFPVVALNEDAEVRVMATLIAVEPKYTLYCDAFTVELVATIVCEPAVCVPENTKLLPAPVTMLLAWMLSVDVPVVNEQR